MGVRSPDCSKNAPILLERILVNCQTGCALGRPLLPPIPTVEEPKEVLAASRLIEPLLGSCMRSGSRRRSSTNENGCAVSDEVAADGNVRPRDRQPGQLFTATI